METSSNPQTDLANISYLTAAFSWSGICTKVQTIYRRVGLVAHSLCHHIRYLSTPCITTYGIFGL